MKNLDDYKAKYDMDLKISNAKIIIALIITILIIGAGIFTACNYQMLDFTYNFDYAYIKMPNGEVIEGEVSAWRDYEDGDQLQVTIGDVTYLTHASNVVLISHFIYDEVSESYNEEYG